MEMRKDPAADAVITWSCRPEESDGKMAFRITVKVVGGICLALFLAGAVFLQDTAVLVITGACSAAAMLIAAGAGWLAMRLSADVPTHYEMTGEGIRIGFGRSADFVRFRSVRYAETAENRIVLHTRFSRRTIFLPEEDRVRLSGCILRRIDEEQSIRYR